MKEIRITVADGLVNELRNELNDYKDALEKIRNTDPLNPDLTEEDVDKLLELNEIINAKARVIAIYLGIENIDI